MRAVHFIVLAILGWLAASSPAFACSCAPVRHDTPLPDVIVDATVLSYQAVERSAVAQIAVHRALKGAIGSRAKVHTAAHAAMCGVVFRQGERLRIGLNRYQGRYITNSCIQFQIAPPR